MSLREDFCILAQVPGCNISDLCRKFGISRDTGYKWLRRYQESGVLALSDQSRRPHFSPGRSSLALEQAVIDLRLAHPVWGPRKLRALLKDQSSASRPSISTVARILQRYGLIDRKGPVLEYPVVGRFERGAPNELWQMDLKAPIRLADQRKVYPVGLLDDHSRYCLGLWLIPNFSAASVLGCWIKAARSYGLPASTLTDHGAQFRMEDDSTSSFRVYLWACGVDHTQGRIKHPQTQGKIERFWGTLNRELFSRRQYGDLASWQRCLDDWREEYNTIRPHQELDDKPPSSRFRPSERCFNEPNRRYWSGAEGVQARRVNVRGWIYLNGQLLMLGRGFAGWTVEARPFGRGCWHIYFHDRFIREYVFPLCTPKS
jgi:transposase InsO family protein